MKLSIITINYNNRGGLQKTIDSVICQTWRDFEWIIIDGGSADGSKELIINVSDNPKANISYWSSEPDKGIYNAMNKGTAKANGEYILFLNSGDELYDEHVLESVFNRNTPDFADIISGQVVKSSDGTILRSYNKNIYLQIYEDTLNHQGTFINRKLLIKYPYDERLKIVSDWKFWVEAVLLNDATIQVIDVTIAKQDGFGISNTNKSASVLERCKVKNELIPAPLRVSIDEYVCLKQSIVYRRLMYLKRHNIHLFDFVRRLLAILLLMWGITNETVCHKEKY